MGNKQPFTVRAFVHGLEHYRNAGQFSSRESPEFVIVITGNVQDVDSRRRKSREFRDDPQVRIREHRPGLDALHIDDVADEIDTFGIDVRNEVEQFVRPTGQRAQVDVREPQRAVIQRHQFSLVLQSLCKSLNKLVYDSHVESRPRLHRMGQVRPH